MRWLDVMNATLIGILLKWANCSSYLRSHTFPFWFILLIITRFILPRLPIVLLPNLSWFLCECTKGSSWNYFMLFPQVHPRFLLALFVNHSRSTMPSLIIARNDFTHFCLLLLLLFIVFIINCFLDTSENLAMYHIILKCYLTSLGLSFLIYNEKKLD